MTEETRTHQIELWLDDRHLEYHRRQFSQPYRSTVHLMEFVRNVMGARANAPMKALDVPCGGGANIFHLSQVLPHTDWTGLDINSKALAIAIEMNAGKGRGNDSYSFLCGDFNNLAKYFPPHSLDLVFSIQTLSWLPEYKSMVAQFLSLLKPGGIVFVTSLFNDFLVDARIEVTQYSPDNPANGWGPFFYNVYSLDRFRQSCMELGASEVRAKDFEMDVDLPMPTDRQMGTFTRVLRDGSRLQFSGPLLMPWKFLAVLMPV